MVERPEDVLVVREPVERERGVELRRELGVGRAPLALAHHAVDVLRDHLRGLVAPRLEANAERVGDGVPKVAVRRPRERGCRWRGADHGVGERVLQRTVEEGFELEKAIDHVVVTGSVADDGFDRSLLLRYIIARA